MHFLKNFQSNTLIFSSFTLKMAQKNQKSNKTIVLLVNWGVFTPTQLVTDYAFFEKFSIKHIDFFEFHPENGSKKPKIEQNNCFIGQLGGVHPHPAGD